MNRSLKEFRQAIDASILSVPLHRHLGISLERDPPRAPRVLMPQTPRMLGPEGHHSPAAVYVLADVAAGVCLCDDIAPRALDMGMAATLLTVSAHFKPGGEATGALEATAEVTKGIEEARRGDRPLKKAIVEVTAIVSGENGEPAGEQRARFYVRFMEPSRLRGLAPESSQLIQIFGT